MIFLFQIRSAQQKRMEGTGRLVVTYSLRSYVERVHMHEHFVVLKFHAMVTALPMTGGFYLYSHII
jgi:hypothetical protein